MNQATSYPWRLFWVLLIGGMLGVAAVMPYVFALFGNDIAQVHLPVAIVLALQFLQSAVMLGIAIGIGLLVARKLGLGAPLLEAWLYKQKPVIPRGTFPASMISGAAVGALIILLVYFVFLPVIPQLPAAAEAALPFWKRFLACFYGGLDEELLMRLFLLSILLWLLAKIWPHTNDTRPTSGAFWLVNIVVALLFGLGHLPAAARLMPITPATITYILSLNGIAAVVFGYLYWKRGLEAAMLAHFSADIVLHVIGPVLIKSATA